MAQIKIAKERIRILFDEAQKIAVQEPELARRYMVLAKRIGMRYNVRLGPLRKKFCKGCYAYFTSSNSSVRLKEGVLRVKCFSCGTVLRMPYRGRHT